jgi:hypothetical protein
MFHGLVSDNFFVKKIEQKFVVDVNTLPSNIVLETADKMVFLGNWVNNIQEITGIDKIGEVRSEISGKVKYI